MRTLKKISAVIVVILALTFACALVCNAHPTASEHNEELESVLFEDGFSKYKSDKVSGYVKALEYASYLTIDQYAGNGESKYLELKDQLKMGGLPLFFSTIDYSYDLAGSGKQINANTHRLYTHQGWERDYSAKGRKIQRFWNHRRKVLLGTVNSIFKFDTITIFGYGDKCESMAGIIYYVHILGDYIEADNYKKISLLPDIAGRNNADDKDKDYDMTTSLRKYCETLFEDQKSSTHYKNLMKKLDEIEKDAGALRNSFGGVNTDEEFEEYHQYAEDLLELLQEHIPELLKKEDFFKKVFYS